MEHQKNRNQYALKEMLKSLVMTKKSVQSVMNERTLLAELSSPFIVNMHYAFQDRDTLYLVLDLMEGGDLRYHIGNKNFNESQSSTFHGIFQDSSSHALFWDWNIYTTTASSIEISNQRI